METRRGEGEIRREGEGEQSGTRHENSLLNCLRTRDSGTEQRTGRPIRLLEEPRARRAIDGPRRVASRRPSRSVPLTKVPAHGAEPVFGPGKSEPRIYRRPEIPGSANAKCSKSTANDSGIERAARKRFTFGRPTFKSATSCVHYTNVCRWKRHFNVVCRARNENIIY